MANGATDPQRNHVRFIVSCITILGIGCAIGGVILIFKGYGGDLLIGGALSAISGLCGFLGAGRPNAPPQDVQVTSQPASVTVTQPEQFKP
jgi:hypothetical protein